MPTIKSFEELIIWQESRKFANNIYKLTKEFPQEELYSLTSQMRRAAVSVMSNIAEGFVIQKQQKLTNKPSNISKCFIRKIVFLY